MVPASELWDEAVKLADEIAANSPTALAKLKDILNSDQDSSAAEIAAYLACLSDGEGREGMDAFLKKRDPNW